MDAKETKGLSTLRILQILTEHSNLEHPLTQEQIASYLERNYGISLERKAIARKLSLLKQAGYEIESDRRGSYLAAGDFTEAELRLLIDGVLCSNYISPRQSTRLIEKLCGLTGKYFRAHIGNVLSVDAWNKTENPQLFLNIELADEAIEQARQIIFTYNKYGVDKKLHPSKSHRVSPYRLILKNQRYYLMAFHEQWKSIAYYRMDRITEMQLTDGRQTPLSSVKGFERGLDPRIFSHSMPYMFTDSPQSITFTADPVIVDQIVDWFGQEAAIQPDGDRLRVRVRVSPDAMEYWALQYLNYVEIEAPVSLRQRLAEDLKKGLKKYE